MKTKYYPRICTSQFCGESGAGCKGCEHKPALDAFKQWVTDNHAIVPDYIWSPLRYVAQEGANNG